MRRFVTAPLMVCVTAVALQVGCVVGGVATKTCVPDGTSCGSVNAPCALVVAWFAVLPANVSETLPPLIGVELPRITTVPLTW
jgi:hypothetical protein